MKIEGCLHTKNALDLKRFLKTDTIKCKSEKVKGFAGSNHFISTLSSSLECIHSEGKKVNAKLLEERKVAESNFAFRNVRGKSHWKRIVIRRGYGKCICIVV